MATLLLFGPARSVAGRPSVTIDEVSLTALCDAACRQFGPEFEKVLRTSALWVNGDPVSGDPVLAERDEVAVVPPVSGGS